VFSALTGKFRTLTHPLRILHNKRKRRRDFENGRLLLKNHFQTHEIHPYADVHTRCGVVGRSLRKHPSRRIHGIV
jgi:hypothetical protein